jgi:16S rRNA processing protein RimM
MKIDDCFLLGYVAKKFGYKGEVILKLDVDNPSDYRELDSVLLNMKGRLVPFFIESSQMNPNGSLRVKFEGVSDEIMLAKILGSELYLPLSVLPQLKGNAFYYHEIIGYELIDQNYGSAGIITGVMDQTVQDIILAEKDGKELMVPVTDGILDRVDREEKKIYVKAPEGLIEMYLEATEDKEEDKDIEEDLEA